MWTVCTPNKKPPISWFNKLLTKFVCKGEQYASLDLQGKVGKYPEVKLLLEKHGYNVRLTAPDTSHQNAPGEQPHQSIANGIQKMLEGPNSVSYTHLRAHETLRHL
eukprot:2042400-Ditylum_brightwellii.AAC.1